jgi:phosphate transport system substrate-binding protein
VAKNAAGKVGSITYSELEWAKLNKLAVANVKNRAGEYVAPSSAGTATFLGAATINANGTLTYDFAKSIGGAYSLGIASYALVYPEASKKDAAKQQIVKDFLSYVVEGCHAKFPDQGFTQLSGPLLAKAKERLALIK